MVAYFFFGVFLLAGFLLLGRWFISVSPASLARGFKWGLGLVAAGVVLYLAFSGRLAVALGALAGIIPFIARWARVILFLKQAFNFRRFFKGGAAGAAGAGQGSDSHSRSGRADQGAGNQTMSQAQALEVLGLEKGASQKDIKDAHHRLIATAHPDQGGSNWLASRINQARDVLLSK